MPVKVEPEYIDVILSGLFDTADRDLRDRFGEVGGHGLQLTPIWHREMVKRPVVPLFELYPSLRVVWCALYAEKLRLSTQIVLLLRNLLG
jgi:hypothetical protein